jgi:hypothetical protein
MSKIVSMAKFKKAQQLKVSDPYCAQLTLPDGRKIAGGPAREARLKAVGGVDQLLRDTLARATALAGRKAS